MEFGIPVLLVQLLLPRLFNRLDCCQSDKNRYIPQMGQQPKMPKGIEATEVSALSGGCDALIGMDVITLGDFSITNHKGITCMSFRCPSSHEIDYVTNLQMGIVQQPHVNVKNVTPILLAANNYAGTSKSVKCLCGSGKQYKHCHGK